MSRTTLPPVNPDKSLAGIAVDPKTLERVIPESRRPDGSVRKELKVRPGFTPQEDVKRFRGTRQAQMDAHQLPKGQILGWVAPSSASTSKPKAAAATEGQSALSKSAAKNAKRSAKKKAQKEQEHLEKIRDNWESSEEEKPATPKAAAKGKESEGGSNTGDKPDATSEAEALAEELDKLEVK